MNYSAFTFFIKVMYIVLKRLVVFAQYCVQYAQFEKTRFSQKRLQFFLTFGKDSAK